MKALIYVFRVEKYKLKETCIYMWTIRVSEGNMGTIQMVANRKG